MPPARSLTYGRAYGRRKRAAAAQSVERLQAIVDQKRAELAAAEEQLQYIMDLEREAAGEILTAAIVALEGHEKESRQ